MRLTELRGEGPTPSTGFIDESAWTDLVQRIRIAGRRRFHVLIKRGSSLPEINLYNRINSSGVPVRKKSAHTRRWSPSIPLRQHGCASASRQLTRHSCMKPSPAETLSSRGNVRGSSGSHCLSRPTPRRLDSTGTLRAISTCSPDNPDLSWVGGSACGKGCVKTHSSVFSEPPPRCERHCCATTCDSSLSRALRLAFALLLKFPEVDSSSLARALLLGQLNRIIGHTKPARIERRVLETVFSGFLRIAVRTGSFRGAVSDPTHVAE